MKVLWLKDLIVITKVIKDLSVIMKKLFKS
jgi:hypothetical protein